MIKPKDYEVDAGVRLTFDTLTDRGFDDVVVAAALDEFQGNLWIAVFGSAVDKAAESIGLQAFPEFVREQWPQDDVVARGVLQAVSDRWVENPGVAFAWAERIGSDRFYEVLADTTGDVEAYFVALAEQGNEGVKEFDYDRNVRPAVDRVEDSYAGTADDDIVVGA